MRTHPIHALLLGTLGFLPLGLAGCGTTVPPGTATVDYQVPPRDVLHIETRSESHAIQVDRRSGTASMAERQRLDAFLDDFGRDRPDSIHAELHGTGSGDQLQRVADLLVIHGVVREKIKLFPGERTAARGAGGTDTVTIAATRAIVVIPACPGWTAHTAAPEDNRVEPKLGCADVSNLAAMISDPYDLIAGQSSPYSDGARDAKAVNDYRNDRVKPLPVLNTSDVTGGSNSGVGAGGTNNSGAGTTPGASQ